MNHDSGNEDWELCNLSMDDAWDSSSFQWIPDSYEESLDGPGSSSGLPAPRRSALGPRFSSPFQLDSQHVAVGEVSHHCSFETGLPRPEVQALPEFQHCIQVANLYRSSDLSVQTASYRFMTTPICSHIQPI